MIRITYDMQADALAIQLQAPSRRAQVITRHPIPGVGVDVDNQGRVYALEVLDASLRIPRETLAALPSPKEYLTLTQAAQESGLAAGTLRVQINNGRLPALKRGRDWFVDATALLNYLESRDVRGRPPTKGPRQTGRVKKTAS